MSIFDSEAFNKLLFFPQSDYPSTAKDSEDLFCEVAPQVKIHIRRHLCHSAEYSLLHFHGNGEIVADYDDFAEYFTELGIELFACDYRGYGKSNGTPTLRGIMEDAHKIYDFLQKQGLLKKTIVMGRSLGSAPAIDLCAKNSQIAALIIESGYADPFRLAARRGVVVEKLTPEEKIFDNGDKIRQVHCPLLILHGELDTLIIPQEAQQNYEQASSLQKWIEMIENVGHNDIMTAQQPYFAAIKKIVDALD